MPATPPLDDIRAKIAEFPGDPYLLTVTAEQRPHCGTVAVSWEAGGTRMVVPAPSSWSGSDAAGLRQVSLLWPPAAPGGYSLIIDGDADAVRQDGETFLALTPRKAVLHRRGTPAAGTTSSCGSDCMPLLRR